MIDISAVRGFLFKACKLTLLHFRFIGSISLMLLSFPLWAHVDKSHSTNHSASNQQLVQPSSSEIVEYKTGKKADHIYTNARIYTVNSKRSWAEAIAVKDGKFLAVGANADMESYIGPKTELIDLQGKLVLPGFHDVHVHLVAGHHFNDDGCSLPGALKSVTPVTPEQVLFRIHQCVEGASLGKGDWVIGQGWSPATFADKDPMFMLRELDKIIPDNPAYLVDETVHAIWVNSKAMEIAGIKADIKDPQFGTIGRDEDSSQLTGIFTDYSAMELIGKHLPKLSLQERIDITQRAIAEFNRFGITSAIEAGTTEADLAALNNLANSDRLSMRVMTKLIAVRSGSTDETVDKAESLLAITEQYQAPGLNTKGIKIWLDGIGDNDSVAIEGISFDHPWLYGNLTISEEKLKDLVVDLDKHGLQAKIHTIGDQAVRVALDAFSQAREQNGMNDLRHHLGHAPLINEKDISRFNELQVGLDIQPNMGPELANDVFSSLLLWVLRKNHLNHAGQWKTLLDAEAKMAVGSDWPVGDMNPFITMYAGLTRINRAKPDQGVHDPDQRLTMEQLIPMYTINGAYLMQQEAQTGSIEQGKFADFIVVDRNIMTAPAEELLQAQVLLTVLSGKPIYQHNDSPIFESIPQLSPIETQDMPESRSLDYPRWWR